MENSVMVNIPRSIKDPSHRYKMPALEFKIEGKGINTHTTLVNLKRVASRLEVPTIYILKFLGFELGAQTIYRDRQGGQSRQQDLQTSVNGIQAEDTINKFLDKFIDMYVLCSKCHLPELTIQIEADQAGGKCRSCGKTTIFDPRQRMTNYILKNPPQNVAKVDAEAGENAPRARREDRPEVLTARTQLREKLKDAKLDPTDPFSESLFTELNNYFQLVLPLNEAYDFDDSHTELLYKAIKRLRLRKELYDRVPFSLFAYIYNRERIMDAKRFATLFESVLQRHKMEDYVGHELILNLTYLFYERYPSGEFTRYIPTIVKLFYEEKMFVPGFFDNCLSGAYQDFFESHVLYNKENEEKMMTALKPFIEWVKFQEEPEEDEEEGEEEEEEGEEEEEQEEEEEESAPQKGETTASVPVSTPAKEEEKTEEYDIDDI